MVAVALPVVVALVASGVGLGYMIPKPSTVELVDETPEEPVIIPALVRDTAPVVRVDEYRRDATGLHCVEWTALDEPVVTLYNGEHEAKARDAWESITTQHPTPSGLLTWWKPDGGLRGVWRNGVSA